MARQRQREAKATQLHGAWWKAQDDSLPAEVWSRVKYLSDQNNEMRLDNAMYLAVVANGNVDGSGSFGSEITQYRMLGLKIRKNLLCALVDTAASLIASNRTIPIIQTKNGDFTLAYQAEQKSRVLHSQMWNLGGFDQGIDAFYDGAIVGTGVTLGLIDPDTGLPYLKRAMPNSWFVDLAEGRNPRSFFWVDFLNRAYLQAVYPEMAQLLEKAQGPSDDDCETFWIREDNKADLVKVVYSWHLPSRTPKDKKPSDGLFTVTTDTALLFKKEHRRKRFPIATYHYARRRAGFTGQGLVERGLPAQIRSWQLQTVIDRCQDMGTNQVYLIEENSNTRFEDLDNDAGLGVYYSGTPPESVVWSGTPADLVSEQGRIWQDLLEQEGLSVGTIGGELPQKGLSSGRAVRAADDVSSRRQVIPTRGFESYYLEQAQLISDLNDDCVEIDANYTVQGYSRTGRQAFLSTSKWADLKIPDGDCRVTVFPMSALPTTPWGKLQAVAEFTEAQYMSEEQAISLMEMPDIEAWQTLKTAPLDLVKWQIERLRNSKPELPIPQQLPYIDAAKEAVNQAYLVAYRTGAPPETLALFDQYIAYADVLIAGATEEEAPPGNENGGEIPAGDGGAQAVPQEMAA